MNLQEFIKESLIQIARGVEDANGELAESNAVVNPRCSTYTRSTNSEDPRAVELIEFDVAVTAAEGKETKGGIGVALSVVTLGTTGKSEAQQSTVSRLKFSIPMTLPQREG